MSGLIFTVRNDYDDDSQAVVLYNFTTMVVICGLNAFGDCSKFTSIDITDKFI